MSNTSEHAKWVGVYSITYEVTEDEAVDEATARQTLENATFQVAQAADSLPRNVGRVKKLAADWQLRPADPA